jgi:hypothetical protein
MLLLRKILCGIAMIGVLAVLPGAAMADNRHDRGRDQHSRRDDHRDYRRDDHRDYRPPVAYAPAPVVSAPAPAQPPVVVNVPVTVNIPTPAPAGYASNYDVIAPSYTHWEVLCRTTPDHPWQISSEYSNRPDAENAADNLEAQGYDVMLRVP